MVLQFLHKHSHGVIAYIELDIGIFLQKLSHGLGHDIAEREGHSYIQFAHKHVLEFLHKSYAVFGSIDALLGVGHKQPPSLSELHLVAVAYEERLVKFAFEIENLLRQRALGNKQLLGSRREIQSLGKFQKVFELSQFHILNANNMLQNYSFFAKLIIDVPVFLIPQGAFGLLRLYQTVFYQMLQRLLLYFH